MNNPTRPVNNPTPQQQAFIDALVGTTSHLVLRARAGTGKTTTIMQGVAAYHAAHPDHEIVVCAFNKAIADEVKEKIQTAGYDWRKVQGATVHSLGWGLVRFVYKLTTDDIKDNKVRDLIRAQNAPIFAQYEAQIGQLVRFAKGAGFGFFPDRAIDDRRAWYELADHHDVNGLEDTSEMDAVVDAAILIYRASLAQVDTVDYDDMILFPLVKNLRVKFQKDLIIVDEYQDTSPTRQALARKFLRPGGRMVAVGDDRQAIYGFTGADSEALDRFASAMHADVLPLTVTWRCPRAVIREAQRIVPDIECATDREGTVESLTWEQFAEVTPAQTDAILCRNTAPLVSLAFSLIRRGVPCRVEGRAIGEGLLRLVDRWKVTSVDAFLERLDRYHQREHQKIMAKYPTAYETKIEELNDRVETMRHICQAVLAQGEHSVAAVRAYVTQLFDENVRGVLTLATYHRSKGREWGRVFLIEHSTRCPSRAARQAWQQLQEKNLAYVAITRAKDTLTYVG